MTGSLGWYEKSEKSHEMSLKLLKTLFSCLRTFRRHFLNFSHQQFSNTDQNLLLQGQSAPMAMLTMMREPPEELESRNSREAPQKGGCSVELLPRHSHSTQGVLKEGLWANKERQSPKHRSPQMTSSCRFSLPTFSERFKVLAFFRVWSFNVHAPYILSADDLGDFSGILWETLHFGGLLINFLRSMPSLQ